MHVDIHEPVNLGGDRYYTLKEVAEKIISLTKSSSQVAFGQAIEYTHRQALPDIALAKEKLGWFPLVALDQGLMETIAFARSSLTLNIDYGLKQPQE
jgi:UDP-glucuronate decarboxylase